MTKGSHKGSNYERQICKRLSLWWTNGKRDDVFWRTAGSGAMATSRRKSNKKTFGQCGDIQAVDPIGQPLLDLFSIELKNGYKQDTLHDLLDKSDNAAIQTFEKFITKAKTDAKNANAKSWLLITKRTGRKDLVTMPYSFSKLMDIHTNFKSYSRINMKIKLKSNETRSLHTMLLDDFLRIMNPKTIEEMLKDYE